MSLKKDEEKDDDEDKHVKKKRKLEFETEDTVPQEKLKLLQSSHEVNRLLANSHLKSLLHVIDEAKDAEEIMQKAMQEPLFVEFADACLKVVDPQSEEEK
ncbi:hypothetical protein NQ317_009098 [Molorchus minor]|uniref:Zinc finger HIT domain-containing protein n=1 Tax=Molorchus minor TaxID=1323400 RepID=A0ABQ9J971_9CUCU|nr:hypothetical protein NQ317_009098 [Molorchus minor]